MVECNMSNAIKYLGIQRSQLSVDVIDVVHLGMIIINPETFEIAVTLDETTASKVREVCRSHNMEIDVTISKTELLEKRIERLEKIVERMDRILYAMNDRQSKHAQVLNDFTVGFGITPDWRGKQ